MATTPTAYALDGLNVLLVDGSQHMRNLVKTILHGLKVGKINSCGDTMEAVAELQHFPADIVMASYYIEPLSAGQFVQALRTGDDTPNPYIPIVMLTGNTEVAVIAELRDVGVNSILSLPTSPLAIYKRIVELIEKPRRFIRGSNYFGPCRRRRQLGPPNGVAERRQNSS